ncbi:hypothetical protein IMG5_173500 [Ichthyophthirius multifiliis]|uniref:Ribosomal protein n=1 Tax=Ichthyophthirius multifiliis TaxID=5932 RepID=G0R1X2_ICHMU|nr:hypothetical protein IMG5_173500 [Ichthyophthirius multifiliis]EGR28533.1 hypothetical protein IMG5_173500 [Ichthyophthirius multifiliis]|eukprot:XP_004029769.1 hypothetical protein IMG5_173500 [Ichthyophthirius multifiliis]
MSKISSETLKSTIAQMLTERKKREFSETIELQIGLRDYDPEKDKRFSGSIKLPNMPYPNKRVAIIGTMKHCDEAKAANIAYIDVEGLKKFNKDKKLIKKWSKPFDTLICSESLMKQVPRLLGNTLNKIGKFPISITEGESVVSKVKELQQTVKFQLKKVICLATAVGTDKLTEEQIRQNINMSINFLVSLLKKGWQNIKTLHIKTTMSKSYRIFG